MSVPFDQDCPLRGAALSHVREGDESPARCSYCREVIDYSERPPLGTVARRGAIDPGADFVLREAGIAPDPLVDRGVILEARLATGRLTGPAWGRGRSWRGDGGLSDRDKSRLVFECLVTRDGR